ncbi:hypothetical protein BDA96_01G530700 [Sorghum bicolor]|uniref:Uncharacterized protein n=2 Tax=Sorghum bicolor TaxID=4558 RepID=A0A921S6P1_SORBI|nr:hypothetical protein BDA96_01G530700 [Sorghum bicolor]KXG40136.1 hypothetical protein SORBI_3001G497400 [Sorghum bicolor]
MPWPHGCSGDQQEDKRRNVGKKGKYIPWRRRLARTHCRRQERSVGVLASAPGTGLTITCDEHVCFKLCTIYGTWVRVVRIG